MTPGHKLMAVTLISVAACSSTASSQSVNVPGARAIDGDSLAIEVRLKGVDAFEHDAICADRHNKCTPCGRMAQNQLAAILDQGQRNGSITITFSKTRSYNRLIATAQANGFDAGEALIASGYAIPQPQYLTDDPQRRERYQAVFEFALAEQRGAFAGRWIEPQKWRQGRRLTCEAQS